MYATVLIVNEEPQVLESLSTSLGALGFQVVIAAGGQAALRYIHQNEFDVVVLDLHMRDTDPVGLLRQIKSLQPLTEVIFMTAHGGIAAAATGMRLGAFDYVLTSEAETELPYKILMGKTRKTQQEDKIKLVEKSLSGATS
ncbi:MAG: response regulator [Thermodesulfobacteriota bacterium]